MTTKVFRLLPDGDPTTGMQSSNFTDQDASGRLIPLLSSHYWHRMRLVRYLPCF